MFHPPSSFFLSFWSSISVYIYTIYIFTYIPFMYVLLILLWPSCFVFPSSGSGKWIRWHQEWRAFWKRHRERQKRSWTRQRWSLRCGEGWTLGTLTSFVGVCIISKQIHIESSYLHSWDVMQILEVAKWEMRRWMSFPLVLLLILLYLFEDPAVWSAKEQSVNSNDYPTALYERMHYRVRKSTSDNINHLIFWVASVGKLVLFNFYNISVFFSFLRWFW